MRSDILIIDSLNLFMRHYVAHPAISDNGHQVGGIVGYLYSIVNLIETKKPKKVIIVWESGGSPRKRQIYKEYKNKRRPQKLNRFYDDLPDSVKNKNNQIIFLIDVLNKMPVNQIFVKDCEADDIIGYLCRYKFKDKRKIILSSDKDYYQLLDENTEIYSPTWKKIVTEDEIVKKFKVHPRNFCIAKCIAGDKSDNISGIKGAGFKTISKRFSNMCKNKDISVADIISECKIAINTGSKIKLYKDIVSDEHIIKRNWRLMYLDIKNLSASHIKKINDSFDIILPVKDKLYVVKKFLREGIKDFNIDRMFLSFSHFTEVQ